MYNWILAVLITAFTKITARIYRKKQKKFVAWLEDKIATSKDYMHIRDDGKLLSWDIQQTIINYIALYDPVYIMYAGTAEQMLEAEAIKNHGYKKVDEEVTFGVTQPFYYQRELQKKNKTTTEVGNVVNLNKEHKKN